ncbi:MAG: mechanosensitive ion channel family protein [Gammaproteobacteria bacterium]|nr:mechanosensitive ion channel family protein [Gammaproteobacteria bacterium]
MPLITDVLQNKNILNDLSQLLVNYGINLIASILILVLGFWALHFMHRAAHNFFLKRNVDRTITKFSLRVVYGIGVIFIVIAALAQLGVQTTSIIAMLSAFTIAIGLSLKDSISNFSAGILLIATRPFRVDEHIEFAEVKGIVQEITILYTYIRTFDHQLMVIPNATILRSNITNYSRLGVRRINLLIGIGYEADLKKGKTILAEIAASDSRILPEPAPRIAVGSLDDNSVNLQFQVWTKYQDYQNVLWSCTEAIKLKFDEGGVSFPTVQKEIHYAGSTS